MITRRLTSAEQLPSVMAATLSASYDGRPDKRRQVASVKPGRARGSLTRGLTVAVLFLRHFVTARGPEPSRKRNCYGADWRRRRPQRPVSRGGWYCVHGPPWMSTMRGGACPRTDEGLLATPGASPTSLANGPGNG